MKKILIIDDDLDMCKLLTHYLNRKGFEADNAPSGNKGLAKIKETNFDVVLCDFRLGDMDGVEVLKNIKRINPAIAVIIITGYSDIKMAVEVMRLGALDYITKPLIPEEVINLINRGLITENTSASSLDNGKTFANKTNIATHSGEFLIGKATATTQLYQQIELVAPTNYSIIIYGESGTGKEVIAKTIHQQSNRKNKPFMAVDCGTLSRELAASELFGHIKGSFTGAINDKEGFFEAANGGTLFLDEVANLPLDVQATLLRVVQERKFKRVGSSKDQETDVRVIVASNENLQEAYRKGKFREDLYHRFNEFSLNIPSLRMRKEDIPLFANYFLEKACQELGKQLAGFDDEVMVLFTEYEWPGNIREFKNVIRRAALLTTSGKINANVLPWEIIGGNSFGVKREPIESAPANVVTIRPISLGGGLKDAAAQAEYNTIMETLKQVKYNKTKAAALLNIDRKTLYNKIKLFEEHG